MDITPDSLRFALKRAIDSEWDARGENRPSDRLKLVELLLLAASVERRQVSQWTLELELVAPAGTALEGQSVFVSVHYPEQSEGV